MPDLNKVMLMGNLTRDPEVRYTPKGTAVGDMSIAINRSWRDDSGAQREEVTFVEIVVWGRQAETCKEYLQKGRPIFVEGRLQLDQWESNGEKKSKLRVLAERIQFLGGGQQQGGSRQAPASKPSAPPAASAPPAEQPPTDSDIPF